MSQRPRCRDFSTSAGCRRGDRCNFSHDIANSPASRRHTVVANAEATASKGKLPRAPKGICDFYWSTGSCKRQTNCKFSHERSPTSGGRGRQNHPGESSASRNVAKEIMSPFLNESGIAKISKSGSDVLPLLRIENMDPQDTRNHLKMFLKDKYRFKSTAQMCSFVALLSNATPENKQWTFEDGQIFLNDIAESSGNGLLRISDILSFQNVSLKAGSKFDCLSFQRGYLPVLQFFTSRFVVKSSLNHLVNALYNQLDINLEHFINITTDSMSNAMVSGSFKDSRNASDVSGGAVFLTLYNTLFEYLNRFKNAVAHHEPLVPFVSQLGEWLETWANGISSQPATFDDSITLDIAEHRAFLIRELKEGAQRIAKIVQREQEQLSRSKDTLDDRERNRVRTQALDGIIAQLTATYEGPGLERNGGPRHDNDFLSYFDIKVQPTDQELVCQTPPFLPANIPNAPHPFPCDSMWRLLDIQFRLLREELIAPLRQSIQLCLVDLSTPRTSRVKSQLDMLKKNRGGRYRYEDNRDSMMFNIYTGVELKNLNCDHRRGMVTTVQLDTPPGAARAKTPGARAAFWRGNGGKRLMQGGLIALLWNQSSGVEIFLGSIASSGEDISKSSTNRDRISINIQFFDSALNFKVLEVLRSDRSHQDIILVESPVMFEAFRPFLEALKREPESFPFTKYLVHPPSSSLQDMTIDVPRYATLPTFSFRLDSLLKNGAEEGSGGLRLQAGDASSVSVAREELKIRSRLDESQAEALIDALTREVALIQGPPGTGKTYIGVEMIRVLVQSGVLPIILIAFTNHALDHMLGSILDAGITKNIVRLGGRCADEKIKQFSLEELQKVAQKTKFSRFCASEYRQLKEVESEMNHLLQTFIQAVVPATERDKHLSIHYPDFQLHFSQPPPWIGVLHRLQTQTDGDDWEVVERSKNVKLDSSLYTFWKMGKDLNFLQQPVRETPRNTVQANRFDILETNSSEARVMLSDDESDASESESELDSAEGPRGWESALQREMDRDSQVDDEDVIDVNSASCSFASNLKVRNASLQRTLDLASESDVEDDSIFGGDSDSSGPKGTFNISDLRDVPGFFQQFGENVPVIPTSDRDLEDLLDIVDGDVWKLSKSERRRLDLHWNRESREIFYQSQKDRFQRLAEHHAELRERDRAKYDEMRLHTIRSADVIGCTTTGAAKLISLLKGLSPRVMVVEEAGQVLESHILASLVGSIEHLVMIGDPLQLRPTLNNYSLSMDNRQSGQIYRFDMSLMERLSSTGFAMSRLDVQRRMRPSISSLIRNTLYEGLIDHDIVKEYPDVRGFAKNVFFLNHSNKEHGGGDDSVSKHNEFEVLMIKDLVKYLMRQGVYSEEGGIVVLCGYLGQLAKVRDALASEMAVIIDERDLKELADREGDAEVAEVPSVPTISRVKITQRVKIRTVDNYQGEEADVIILSLVRNSGGGPNSSDVVGLRRPPNIGFFKSENRTNVALSRARHGLFILGNANDFSSRSNMWSTVIDDLQENDAVGTAFPISCFRHMDEVRYVSQPGQLPLFSPDGGCLRACDHRLSSCGHKCPYKCHADDENHVNVRCVQPCQRLCVRGHPCKKECGDDCGKCVNLTSRVRLPCGHIIDEVPCWKLDDLARIYCSQKILRALPTCEHSTILACGLDLSSYNCKAMCDGSLACCSKSCASKCHECREINMPGGTNIQSSSATEDTEPENHIVQRIQHKKHNCSKTLNCGHQCSGICSAEHKDGGCFVPCKRPCQQVCQHSICRNPCSQPCSPCKERCSWSCPHGECPVPCGSVCARLPCDKPCTKFLKCNHRCPSVCGENCEDQLCRKCATGEQLDKVADLIMQRSLADLPLDSSSIDDLTITLKGCGHTFTVETLDGHCGLSDFYTQNSNGEWKDLKAPPHGFKNLPTCPTCRSGITCHRYGRVYKRARLDILERNVAARMGQAMSLANQRYNALSVSALEAKLRGSVIQTQSGNVDFSKKSFKRRMRNQKAWLNQDRQWLASWDVLDPSSDEYHGVSAQEATVWHGAINNLKSIYQDANSLARTRSAHMDAWEAAYASLYREEIDKAVRQPSRAPRHPEEYAARVAKLKIGQSKPLADQRFCVEAIWLTLAVRFTLANMAKCWLELASSRPNYLSRNGAVWAKYVGFVLETCLQDAQMALGIASASASRRQMSRSRVLVLRAELELFKFSHYMRRLQGGMSLVERNQFGDEAVQHLRGVRSVSIEEAKFHTRVGDDQPEVNEAQIFETILEPIEKMREEWEGLEKAVRLEAYIVPLNYEEKVQVIAALNFGYSGHFYNCPNGHTFVIGECGGATETARCPDCQEQIGGSGHNLLQSNSQNLELEGIARTLGHQQSPFEWGRI